MPDWMLALVALALVGGVLALAAFSVKTAVESRVLVVGFLLFFAISLIAGAGLLPTTPAGEETATRLHSAYVLKTGGGTR